jgi:hypothetical protein
VGSTSTSSQHGGGEPDTVALAANGKKKVSKKGPKARDKKKSGGEQHRDMRKVKCFACHKLGKYIVQCPNKKKKQVAASTDMEDFSSKFDREFSLVTCLATCSVSSSVWYIDSGASTHMSGVRGCFFELNERGVFVEVELGVDRFVRAVDRGTISFQRESRHPLRFRDVYYVPGLQKNLISISTIEDRGFEVCFREGRVYILPRGTSFASTKVIGTQCGKLYRLDF